MNIQFIQPSMVEYKSSQLGWSKALIADRKSSRDRIRQIVRLSSGLATALNVCLFRKGKLQAFLRLTYISRPRKMSPTITRRYSNFPFALVILCVIFGEYVTRHFESAVITCQICSPIRELEMFFSPLIILCTYSMF